MRRYSTVYSLFRQTAVRHGERPFLHIPAVSCKPYHDGDIGYRYGQMLKCIDDLAARYHQSAYRQGHRVALLLENRPEFFMHWLALNALGVSVVPINGEMRAEEQRYLLAHSESCLLICIPEKRNDMQGVADSLAVNLPLLSSDDLHRRQAQIPKAPSVLDPWTETGLKTECAMLFTSGSTGKPKGCILTNEYFIEFGLWYRDIGGYCELKEGRERLLTPLPLCHMNAMAVSSLGMMITGGCLIQLDRFHPSTWWQTVKSSGATALHYLGVLPAILLNLPKACEEKNLAVKFGFGAGVNPKHHAAFEKRFGFPLIEAWAMSECGAGGCIVANHEPRHVGTSCFGVPDPSRVEYRLVDEFGRDVKRGDAGELLVRRSGADPGKGFFSGYHKNKAATREAWEGGWLHTGDIVRQGEDDAMHFVDRRKNVIRRSGENIAALEVEAALVHSHIVAQVAVTAAPDEMRGDEVLAFVVPEKNVAADEVSARTIFACAMDQLVYYKAPGYVVFVDDLPLTASQKPQRAEIKKLARKIVANGTAGTGARLYDLRDLKRRPGK